MLMVLIGTSLLAQNASYNRGMGPKYSPPPPVVGDRLQVPGRFNTRLRLDRRLAALFTPATLPAW